MNKNRMLLQLFADANGYPAPNVNVTTANTVGNDLSAEMKIFYRTSMLQNARNEHRYNQFGQKQALPKNNGSEVEWRKLDTFAPALTPLTEGVTPDGNKVNVTKISKKIAQYGDYTTISDRLELEAIDPIITGVTEEHGAQAGDTLEIITRNELMTGTNIYTAGKKAKSALTAADVLTLTLVNQAATHLKKMHAPTINGDYICIVHPSVAYDIRETQGWIEVHKYSETTEIFNGEIGKIHGVRFLESTLAPVEKAGASNAAVYHSFMFGKDAYGIIDPSAESLEIIVKQRGSAGTADPLDQRSTVGWKASHAAKILYPERLVDIITGSFFSDTDVAN